MSCHATGAGAGATATPERWTGLPFVALVGNPNVGKSTLFNALTGAHQRVGNWPGKTVCVAQGDWRTAGGRPLRVADLPGSYSLLPDSPDEALVRDVLTAPEGSGPTPWSSRSTRPTRPATSTCSRRSSTPTSPSSSRSP